MKNSLYLIGVYALLAFSCTDAGSDIEELDNDLTTDFSDVLTLPSTSFNYSAPNLPQHFLANNVSNIDNTPNNNPVTDAGATLGRVLFYDSQLSANNTIACGSCHLQEDGFADTRRLSIGFLGGETGRNSMGLANARYYNNGRFFWDERARSLEEQVLLPIQDEVEMGLSLSELVNKLQTTDYYQPLFQDAFGSPEVNEDKISRALSQFVRSMVSYEAKFDIGAAQVNNIENNNFPNFTELENLGKQLFFSNRTQCSNCHETATFSGDQARNNGLDAMITDEGVGGANGNNQDRGRFKTNSLRNIALTTPYMHDGRFTTLREVVQFYNNGIQNSPMLDNRLRAQNGQPLRMNLNNQEIDALVSFLNTLTDAAFITNEKFSDPFVMR
jgi:cytochrome c peroxidase